MKRPVMFLITVTLLLYLPSLFFQFVFDDHYLITQNPLVQSSRGLKQAFLQDYYGQANPQYSLGYYRPIAILTHWTDWHIWRDNPFGHHLTNILIHILVVVMLYQLLVMLLNQPPAALLAALLFALHPSHVNTVTFISGRVDSLAALFCLTALLLSFRRYWLSPPFYFLALLCKEISGTLPVLVFWKEREHGLRKAFLKMIPFAAVLLIVLLIRWNVLGRIGRDIAPPAESLPAAFLLLIHYIRLMVLPPLQLYFEPSAASLPLGLSILSAVLFVAGLVFLTRRKTAAWSAVWLITLLPVLGFFRIETLLDERFLYLPSVSFCLLAGAWVYRYLENRNDGNAVPPKQVWVAAAILILVYGPLMITRQFYWQNDLSLWKSAAETEPESARIRFRLGVAHLQSGEFAEAESEFQSALSLKPETPLLASAVYSHLATARQIRGNEAGVEELYRKALQITPGYYTGHFNLGVYLEKSGRLEESVVEFQEAARLNPLSPAPHRKLAEILDQLGRKGDAQMHVTRARELE